MECGQREYSGACDPVGRCIQQEGTISSSTLQSQPQNKVSKKNDSNKSYRSACTKKNCNAIFDFDFDKSKKTSIDSFLFFFNNSQNNKEFFLSTKPCQVTFFFYQTSKQPQNPFFSVKKVKPLISEVNVPVQRSFSIMQFLATYLKPS